MALAMKAFFRGLAAAFKKAAPAQAIAGVLLLALSLYTGYQIPKPSMIGALRWISYINVSFEDSTHLGVFHSSLQTAHTICF